MKCVPSFSQTPHLSPTNKIAIRSNAHEKFKIGNSGRKYALYTCYENKNAVQNSKKQLAKRFN